MKRSSQLLEIGASPPSYAEGHGSIRCLRGRNNTPAVHSSLQVGHQAADSVHGVSAHLFILAQGRNARLEILLVAGRYAGRAVVAWDGFAKFGVGEETSRAGADSVEVA